MIEEHFEQNIVVRGDEIIITGANKRIDELTSVLQTLISIAAGGGIIRTSRSSTEDRRA
jgi:hypothetical protein